jgi:phage shock protein A
MALGTDRRVTPRGDDGISLSSALVAANHKLQEKELANQAQASQGLLAVKALEEFKAGVEPFAHRVRRDQKALQDTVRAAEASLSASLQQVSEKEKQIAALKQEIANVQRHSAADLERLSSSLEDANLQLVESELNLAGTQSELARCHESIGDLEKGLSSARDAAKTAEFELATARMDLNDLVEDAQEALSIANARREAVERKVALLQEQVANKDAVMNNLALQLRTTPGRVGKRPAFGAAAHQPPSKRALANTPRQLVTISDDSDTDQPQPGLPSRSSANAYGSSVLTSVQSVGGVDAEQNAPAPDITILGARPDDTMDTWEGPRRLTGVGCRDSDISALGRAGWGEI